MRILCVISILFIAINLSACSGPRGPQGEPGSNGANGANGATAPTTTVIVPTH